MLDTTTDVNRRNVYRALFDINTKGSKHGSTDKLLRTDRLFFCARHSEGTALKVRSIINRVTIYGR